MKHSKVSKLIAIALCCIFLVSFIYESHVLNALADGSKNLTATKNGSTWVSNSGYRPYTEWYNQSTAGIPRKQIIKAFVNSGEIIYLEAALRPVMAVI